MVATNELEKDILLSLKGRYWQKIIAGVKRYEIRKTFPKIDLPFRVLVYLTKSSKKEDLCYWFNIETIGDYDAIEVSSHISNGSLVGEFIVDEIIPIDCDMEVKQSMLDKMCLTKEELLEYGNGGIVYAWHISSVKKYDVPRSISSVLKKVNKYDGECSIECSKCHWHYMSIYYYSDDGCTLPLSNSYEYSFLPIFTSPQSWCYCYSISEKEGEK